VRHLQRELASIFGRHGYRRNNAPVRRQGWHVNHKRVARIWRREWPGRLDVQAFLIEPGSRWENGYDESFDGKLPDELLGRDLPYTEADEDSG
jgi:hypothetical protein